MPEIFYAHPKGSRKKGSSLNGRAIKEKNNFFRNIQHSKISTAMKLEWGGGLGLNGPALREDFFCGFP